MKLFMKNVKKNDPAGNSYTYLSALWKVQDSLFGISSASINVSQVFLSPELLSFHRIIMESVKKQNN